ISTSTLCPIFSPLHHPVHLFFLFPFTLFFLIPPPPPCSTLFPYTTLFRSALIRGTKTAFIHRTYIFKKSINFNFDEATRIKIDRSEEHTSELQSRFDLVCRLLLEKKKKQLQYTLSDPRKQHTPTNLLRIDM